MDLNERIDAAKAKMDELKSKMEDANEAVKESWKQGVADFKSDMEFTKNTIAEISDEEERKLELKAEGRIEKIVEADEKIEAKKEERHEASMAKKKSLQDKINSLSQAYAKADQEELIMDLIDYAEECQENAAYMAEEAILAYKAAAEQIALYNEKYGK